MENRRRNIVIVAVAVIILATAAVWLWQRPRSSSATIRLGYLHNTGSLPLFVAEEKGYLAAEGIRHESIPIATSNQLVDGLLAGNLDATPESSAFPVLAVEQQSPGRLKIYSASLITRENPFDSILVKSSSPITSLAGLAGKRIGVFPGATAMSLLKKFLADTKVDVSGITFVPIPPQNQLVALLEGSIDAVHSYEPTTAIALSKGGIRKLHGSVYAELLEPNSQGVGVVSTKFVHEHPETARKLIRALAKAMAFIRENPAEARRILGQHLGLEAQVAQSTVLLDVLPFNKLDPAVVQKYADLLSSLGELKGPVDAQGLLYRE